MNKALSFILGIFLTFSCSKPDEGNMPNPFLSGSGAFIINEGNFRMGNGSLSFYSYDSLKVYNDVFSQINGRILGDIPNSIRLNGSNVWIVVNNSGKIEIADRNTLMSVKTITGLKSPRHIAFDGNDKIWITSMYSDSLTVLDLRNLNVSGYVNIRCTSESIEVVGQEAFVANWIGGNEIMVVNTAAQEVTDSIQVGMEPESMVIDRNNNLWVLCNGGWTGQYNAELVAINTDTHDIIKRFVFQKMANPSCLQINGSRDTLYFIQNGIQRISLNDNSLPSSAFIQPGTRSFYKIGIDPVRGDIFATDAADYQQKGYLLHYRPDGTFLSEYRTDIIPGLMVFKITN
jgi:DNA-binding beta-propeller fold protein YncE